MSDMIAIAVEDLKTLALAFEETPPDKSYPGHEGRDDHDCEKCQALSDLRDAQIDLIREAQRKAPKILAKYLRGVKL